MFTTRTSINLAMAIACGLLLTACATTRGKGSATTGHQLVQGAKGSKSNLMAQKHKGRKTPTPPKAVPAAVHADGQKIEPPAMNYDRIESWNFADVDIDGTGEVESGLACYDSSTNTLFVWWSDAMDLGGDGDIETYDGFFWINDTSAGVILDLTVGGDQEILACVDQMHGWSGWILALAGGNSEVMALDASYKK